MAAYSDWDVQKAVYARLTADAGLTALLSGGAAGVHDHVPENSGFPYIVIGEIAGKPLETIAAGGRDLALTLHAYSRAHGFKELRLIMAAVHAALHDADFVVAGHNLALCLETGSATTLQGDGVTRHGKMEFHIITEPED